MKNAICPNCGAVVDLSTSGDHEHTTCSFCCSSIERTKAEACFEEIQQSKVGGLLLLASIAQEGGSYKEAVEHYNKVIEQVPASPDAWLNKGICLVRTSTIGELKIEEAISCWKAALRFAKQPEFMTKRVEREVNLVACQFYPVLADHYRRFETNENAASDFWSRFEQLDRALAWALGLSQNPVLAKSAITLCDQFEKDAGLDFDKEDAPVMKMGPSQLMENDAARASYTLVYAFRKIRYRYEAVLDPTGGAERQLILDQMEQKLKGAKELTETANPDPKKPVVCPACKHEGLPVVTSELTSGGWISVIVLFFFCLPLCWTPFVMDDYKVKKCKKCGARIS